MKNHLTDPDCPQSVRDQINGAAQPTSQAIQQAREWHEADRTVGDVMLYTLRQDGWRKGEPVMVNDVTIHIEAAHGSTTDIGPIVAAIREALSVSASEREAMTYRHKKRGSEYVLIGIGKMQAELWLEQGEGTIDLPGSLDPVDMREVAIYQSVDDGALWVRPREEFEDGRFEEIRP